MQEGMTCLEKRIMTRNPTIPMNIYRSCPHNNQVTLFQEMEQFLQAYYDLIDYCEAFPLWKRKMQEDLGGSVSFLAIAMEETLRDKTVSVSAAFKRFDSEK